MNKGMKDSKGIIERAAREIAASRRTSTTAAGRTEPDGTAHPSQVNATQVDAAQVDAINQVFALFRLNYHNQYYAAYPQDEQLMQIKRLWLDALAGFPAEQLLRGAKRAIETSEYLPTLAQMLRHCHQALADLGLPEERAAYREACQARSPRSAQPWSHPAVYLAGRDTGWNVLAGEPEAKTWPLFRQHYRSLCGRVMAGEPLEIPAPRALPAESGEPSSTEEALAEIDKILASLKNSQSQ